MDETQAIAKLAEYCAEFKADARKFVRHVYGANPTVQQDLVLAAISEPGAKVAVKSGHGTGKSTLASWVIEWFVLLFGPHCVVPVTAPSASQLDNIIWRELAIWKEKAIPWFGSQIDIVQGKCRLRDRKEQQFAVARTARPEKPEALAGFHAPEILYIIEEASGVHDDIFVTAQGALSTPNARALMISNPTKTSGYFYNAFHKRIGADWKIFTLNAEESPLVATDYITDMREAYGRDSDIYRVRVLGEFPNQSVLQLIPTDLIEAARKRPQIEANWAPVVLGVDCAREGDDRNVIFKRQGPLCWLLFEQHGIKDTQIMADIVAAHIVHHNPDAVFIDVGAAGAGVIDRVRALGHKVTEVNFGKAAASPRYVNKRTEMWFNLRDWLQREEGILPDLDSLADELKAPEFYFAGGDKLMLERKVDIKKRLTFSPDLGDALALTFAAPVAKKSERLGETNKALTGKKHGRR